MNRAESEMDARRMEATATPTGPVFTLEARSNFMLELIAEQFRLSDEQVFKEIHGALNQLKAILVAKDVPYEQLKSALVPRHDKLERAYVFNWAGFEAAERGWYGRAVIHRLLPALGKSASHSVLCGDWTAKDRFSDVLSISTLNASSHSVLRTHGSAPDTLYFVYLNNLTEAAATRIEAAFAGYAPYLGSLDLTYQSPTKGFLSTMLVRAFLIHKRTVIQGHEDDRDDSDDVNLVGYDFGRCPALC